MFKAHVLVGLPLLGLTSTPMLSVPLRAGSSAGACASLNASLTASLTGGTSHRPMGPNVLGCQSHRGDFTQEADLVCGICGVHEGYETAEVRHVWKIGGGRGLRGGALAPTLSGTLCTDVTRNFFTNSSAKLCWDIVRVPLFSRSLG